MIIVILNEFDDFFMEFLSSHLQDLGKYIPVI